MNESPFSVPLTPNMRRELRAVLLVLLGSVALIAVPASMTVTPVEMAAPALLFLAALCALYQLRSGRVIEAAYGLTATLLLIGVIAVVSYGSIRSITNLAFVGAAIAAGIFLGRRALAATILIASAIVGVLVFAENAGLMTSLNRPVGLAYWIVYSAVLLIVGIAVHYPRLLAAEAIAGQQAELLVRQKAEEELRKAHDEYQRILIEQAAILNTELFGIAKFKERKIQWANPGFEKIFGYAPGEAVGIDGRRHYVTESAYQAIGAAAYPAMESGNSFSVQLEHKRKDGTVIWLNLRGAMLDRENAETLWEFVDISDLKQREAELDQAKRLAEQANNSKSRFLAAASHDLRQPLSALNLYVGVLRSKVPPACVELVASVEDCVDSLSALLTDILDLSKLDAGVVKPNPSAFAVADLLAEIASIHATEAQLKGIRFRVRRCPTFARTDRKMLQRIVGNLVSNAVRYTDKGGVLVGCRRHQGKRWLEVWDTGIGIAAEQMSIIFEEFRQLDPKAQSRGSGLGLSIVAKCAALLGLRIRSRSRPGRGSMFAIELPPGREEDVATAADLGPAAHALRIALVEDNPRVLDSLVLALEGAGNSVVAAPNGTLLFARLGDAPPDIVISDYRLADGESGFDVIERARRRFGSELPALLFTGDTDPNLIRSMADRGIAVLYKPIQIEPLLAFIGKATARA